jgi:hypothetical protein
MPTVLELEGFRFFFYSGDRHEPPHVHVRKAGIEAKFWLAPLRPAKVGRFKAKELRRIVEIITLNEAYILERWNEHFS